MVGYLVVKSQFGFGGKVYKKGETVELSDEDALFFISQNVVIAQSETKLPTEADGLFAELQKKITDLEKTIEQQKGMIANFAKEIEVKNSKIAEMETKRRR